MNLPSRMDFIAALQSVSVTSNRGRLTQKTSTRGRLPQKLHEF